MSSMKEDLCRLVEKIEKGDERHFKLARAILQADEGKFFQVDFLAVAAINRSLSNSAAFVQLVRAGNYLVAASLLRLQLDTFLRFYAAYLVKDPHDFAKSVLGGKAVRKMKDRSGAFMTDKYLHESAASEFPWISRVYNETSGFIHLSDKHIVTTLESLDEHGMFTLTVGPKSSRFTDDLWSELADGFVGATEALFIYLEGWGYSKANPELLVRYRQRLGEGEAQP